MVVVVLSPIVSIGASCPPRSVGLIVRVTGVPSGISLVYPPFVVALSDTNSLSSAGGSVMSRNGHPDRHIGMVASGRTRLRAKSCRHRSVLAGVQAERGRC